MRNLKRVLSLVLAAMMLIGMMVIGASAAGSTKAADYSDAILKLTKMGVVEGYPDGSYHENDTITRAQMAAIIYRVMTGDNKGNSDDAAATNFGHYAVQQFSDVTASNWAVGYIGYCANAGIIEGYPDGTFQPNKQITVYEVMAMLLRAVGYGKNPEYKGSDWTKYVLADANQTNIYNGVVKAPDAGADRGVVAQLTFNAATRTARVTYTPGLGYVRVSNSLGTATVGRTTLIELNPTADSYDVWGNPSDNYSYTYTIPNKSGTFSITAEPDLVYTTAVDDCDIIEDLGFKGNAYATIVVDGECKNTWGKIGEYADGTAINGWQPIEIGAKNTTIAKSNNQSGTGVLTKVYVTGNDTILITEVNTWFAEVSKVYKEIVDKNDHVIQEASVDLTVYTGNGKATESVSKNVLTADYSVGDYALITKAADNANFATAALRAQGKVQSIAAATPATTGKVSDYYQSTESTIRVNGNVTIGGTKYSENVKFFYVEGSTGNLPVKNTVNYEVYTDAYGNVIALTLPKTITNYAILDNGVRESHGYDTIYKGKLLTDFSASTASTVGVASYNTNAHQSWPSIETGTSIHHIVSYSVDANGNYVLNAIKTEGTSGAYVGKNYVMNDGAAPGATGVIVKGDPNIYIREVDDANIRSIADDETIYVIENAKTHTFTQYVGYKNVPSLSNIQYLEVVVGKDTMADLVYIVDGAGQADTSTVYAWFIGATTGQNGTMPYKLDGLGNDEYVLYKNMVIDGKVQGSTAVKKDSAADTALAALTGNDWGLYKLTKDADGYVTAIEKQDTIDTTVTSVGSKTSVNIGGKGYSVTDKTVIWAIDQKNMVAEDRTADGAYAMNPGDRVFYAVAKEGSVELSYVIVWANDQVKVQD